MTQQYERLISGKDKVNGIAQFSVYLKNKEKGAPIAFVFPPDGVIVGPTVTGIVDRAPHPEAARLFVDWLLSPVGQAAYVKANYYYSLRKDVAPPPGGRPIAEMKLLVPDWEEALAISDRVIVMNGGVIEQNGTPSEIYNAPRNAFVADFIGSANLIRGRIRRDESGDGMIALETPGGRLVYGVDRNRTAGTEGVFAIRTAYPVLSRARPAGARNVWPARITRRVFLGDSIEYLVAWEDAALVVRTRPTEEFDEGEEVHVALEPRHCVLIES